MLDADEIYDAFRLNKVMQFSHLEIAHFAYSVQSDKVIKLEISDRNSTEKNSCVCLYLSVCVCVCAVRCPHDRLSLAFVMRSEIVFHST